MSLQKCEPKHLYGVLLVWLIALQNEKHISAEPYCSTLYITKHFWHFDFQTLNLITQHKTSTS